MYRASVITSRLQSVVRAMSNTLLRTASSSVLSAAKDFSCCVTTWNGDLIVAGDSIPIHVMSGQKRMVQTVLEHHHDIRPGDAFLHNSPYHGNTHAADHTIMVPVFATDTTDRFWVHVKAHLADIGNSRPTTYAAFAADVYEEGALIFPGVLVQRDNTEIGDIIRMCELRFRAPKDWYGDFNAMIAAARIGERRLVELGDEIGWAELDDYVDVWFHYSEQLMRRAVGRLKSGEVTVYNHYDPSKELPEGISIRVHLKVDPQAGLISADLRDNPPCVRAGVNLSEATANGSVLTGVFTGLPIPVPANAGSFRCVDIQLAENCVVGIPRFPASCSAATTNLSHRLVNTVARGMTDFGGGRAETGYLAPPAQGVISGRQPQTNEPFVNQIFLNIGAGGASQWSDGWLLSTIAAAGMLYHDSVEILEQKYPIVVYDARIVADREGAGRNIGAPGGRVEFGPIRTSLQVEYSADGKVNGAAGVQGGYSGALTQIFVRRDGDVERMVEPFEDSILLGPGDTVVTYAAGGAGFGDPFERDPALVERDVRDGWVSVERARQVYGVFISATGDVDHHKTRKLRQAKANTRL